MMPMSNARTTMLATLAATILIVLAANASHSEISARDSEALSKANLIYVATVRKDGNQSKAAPVWFTTSADKASILVQTGKDTWKVKRIKRGSPVVLVWIGSANGPAFVGKAEISADSAIRDKILEDFRNKYWENRVMGVGPSRERFDSGERVVIKITPVRDLPDNFSSGPGTPPPPLEGSAPASSH
jgi:general stress protein 26